MGTKQHTITCLLLLLVLATPGLVSAAKGRFIGKVTDMDHNPLAGVSVTVTCDADPDYERVVTTNLNGVFRIEIFKLHTDFHLSMRKTGYLPIKNRTVAERWGTGNCTYGMPWDQEVSPISTEAIDAMESGITALEAEDLDTAVAKLLEATRLNPELHHAWAVLSFVLVAQERYEQAIQAAEKAIDLGHTSLVPLGSLRTAYRHIGTEEESAEASKALEEATQRLLERLH